MTFAQGQTGGTLANLQDGAGGDLATPLLPAKDLYQAHLHVASPHWLGSLSSYTRRYVFMASRQTLKAPDLVLSLLRARCLSLLAATYTHPTYCGTARPLWRRGCGCCC